MNRPWHATHSFATGETPNWRTSTPRPLPASGEMSTHLTSSELGSAAPTTVHSWPRWTPAPGLRARPWFILAQPSRLNFVVREWPVRTGCEVAAHLASCEFGAAPPTACHPWPSRAPNQIERRITAKLLETNPAPAPAAIPRYTLATERQRRAFDLICWMNVFSAA